MPARAAVKTAPVARQLSKAAVSSPRILITAKASRHAAAVATTTRFFSSTPTAAAATAPSSTGSAASTAALDWNSFFQLRVKRRRIQMVFSIFSGIMSGAAGAVVLSSGAADTLVGMVPLDPFATLGIATVCAGGIGWLVGPSIGSQLFYLLNRRYKTQMLEKESEFLTRVKKHRSDPTNSSTSNPGMSISEVPPQKMLTFV